MWVSLVSSVFLFFLDLFLRSFLTFASRFLFTLLFRAILDIMTRSSAVVATSFLFLSSSVSTLSCRRSVSVGPVVGPRICPSRAPWTRSGSRPIPPGRGRIVLESGASPFPVPLFLFNFVRVAFPDVVDGQLQFFVLSGLFAFDESLCNFPSVPVGYVQDIQPLGDDFDCCLDFCHILVVNRLLLCGGACQVEGAYI